MPDILAQVRPRDAFYSSVAADVWHDQTTSGAYEWWYFDALSDDGREAVVIIFTDNYVFSPRYASAANMGETQRFPAVTFIYYVNGKAVFHTVNEYTARQFDGGIKSPGCRIGDNSFRVDSADYGSGYVVNIDLPVSPGRRLRAEFEWLSIESDMRTAQAPDSPCDIDWNLVASRSDVTGHIELVGRRGNIKRRFQFRGTGYHDHLSGVQPLHDAIVSRQWGRAHYSDNTAVYCIQQAFGDAEPNAKLAVVSNNQLSETAVSVEEQRFRRDKYGIKYPSRITLTAADSSRLKIKPLKVFDAGFYSLRMISEMTLMLGDGKPRKTIGISEVMAPKNLKYRLFRWFNDFRIGRNGKGAYF